MHKLLAHFVWLFLFLSLSPLSASVEDDDVFINGPQLSVHTLWEQIQARSPYRLGKALPENATRTAVAIDGLLSIARLIEISKTALGERCSGVDVQDYQISFHSSEASFERKPKTSQRQAASKRAPSVLPDLELPQQEITEPTSSTTPKYQRLRRKAHIVPKDRKALNSASDRAQHMSVKNLEVDTPAPKITSKNIPLIIDDPQPQELAGKPMHEGLSELEVPSEEFQRRANPDHRSAPQPTNQAYQLKPGDEIEISVWGEDMTRNLIVSPDGKVSYILVGEIDVLNKTFNELKLELEEKLNKYLLEPNVTIIGKSYKGNYVSILGAVNQPGRKVVAKSDRVLDVIAKAAGLRYENFGDAQGEMANLKNAYLSRRGRLIPVDFSKLLYEGDMSQNVHVEIGDFIYIPSSVGNPIFITGEVFLPTSMPFRGEPTLLEAIAKAKGIKSSANKKSIFIVSGGMQKPQVDAYNYYDITTGVRANPRLEPGDIIYIPPTTLTRIERLSIQIIPFLDTIIRSGTTKTTIQDW